MNIRRQYELLEDNMLSPHASRSTNSRGRVFPIAPCEVRTEYQRDRDRIIHAKSFRRLKQKTQVFIAPEGDHFRTRLTHTLEVAQIARTIARALRLNEDLTEAIALAHDLGHTPFGHAGEKALNGLFPGGFRHYEQSMRVVDVLEGPRGLNLTCEVRDGILRHTGEILPTTLEGMVVRISDRIAYINHDIDDALRAGLIGIDDIPRDCMKVLGMEHGERIDTMVKETIRNSVDQPSIMMGPLIAEATEKLREFLFARVYLAPQALREEEKVHYIIQKIYQLVMQQPELMGVDSGLPDEALARRVVDFVAGMTDRYALNFFNSHFLPYQRAEIRSGIE
ncbi:MAG: deoxyguanosinetriphosphate triphosphohydrolase [Syntrophomonadaceae bacterium]|nr:deoxyguanosinetriphosphate triphosphohydrolase [Syntrophomonadaceae bacterium]